MNAGTGHSKPLLDVLEVTGWMHCQLFYLVYGLPYILTPKSHQHSQPLVLFSPSLVYYYGSVKDEFGINTKHNI